MHARANQISCSNVAAGMDRGGGRSRRWRTWIHVGADSAAAGRKNVLANNFFRQVGTSLADSELNSMLLRAGGRRDDSEPGHGLVLRPQHVQAATAASSDPSGSPVPVM